MSEQIHEAICRRLENLPKTVGLNVLFTLIQKGHFPAVQDILPIVEKALYDSLIGLAANVTQNYAANTTVQTTATVQTIDNTPEGIQTC